MHSSRSHRVRLEPTAFIVVVALGLVLSLRVLDGRDHEPLAPGSARIDVRTTDASGQLMPARVYLFRDGRPFRLGPVESLLPINVDYYYRERLWRRNPRPRTLEVTCNGDSHVILLRGHAQFTLPPGRYRLEAYRGFSYQPASHEFEIRPGETRPVNLKLSSFGPRWRNQWLAGDDHIHLTRERIDDDVFLQWLRAEDLAVGNFLQMQRQIDGAVQYAFGRAGEARLPGHAIRAGQETRSSFYGHVNLLGADRLLRPLSLGLAYGTSPEAYPFPLLLFERARRYGGTVGYAHFDGSQKHSTALMDLALQTIDFVEVFQFGVLKSEAWYELLNAGLRVTGIAGSDFPVPLNDRRPWPRALPLLGPERTLVKAEPGRSAYESWAAGVRKGHVVVSNGPLLEFTSNGVGPGAVVSWDAAATSAEGEVTASFYRPIERVDIVLNGRVVATESGDGQKTELSVRFRIPVTGSSWVAARATARRVEHEPEIWAHSNPVYLLRGNRPVRVKEDCEKVLTRWSSQVEYFRSSDLTFADERQRTALLSKADEAMVILRRSCEEPAAD